MSPFRPRESLPFFRRPVRTCRRSQDDRPQVDEAQVDEAQDHGARVDEAQNEARRIRAVRALGLLDTRPEKRFDDITERARTLLGTAGAAFSIVDEDRLFNKSFSGLGRTEVPLRGAVCAVTIESDRAFIVPDAWTDDRFVTHPAVRFYAGYPVEAPGGERIGALCVIDPAPRSGDDVDLVLLRELALSVQRELAAGAVGTPAATG